MIINKNSKGYEHFSVSLGNEILQNWIQVDTATTEIWCVKLDYFGRPITEKDASAGALIFEGFEIEKISGMGKLHIEPVREPEVMHAKLYKDVQMSEKPLAFKVK